MWTFRRSACTLVWWLVPFHGSWCAPNTVDSLTSNHRTFHTHADTVSNGIGDYGQHDLQLLYHNFRRNQNNSPDEIYSVRPVFSVCCNCVVETPKENGKAGGKQKQKKDNKLQILNTLSLVMRNNEISIRIHNMTDVLLRTAHLHFRALKTCVEFCFSHRFWFDFD